MRVLVTGFHDWRASDARANVWRCRDNPSCRVLVGEGDARPTAHEGPLARRLRLHREDAAGQPIAWTFQTLPVVWGAFSALSASEHDVVIHLGLGVYERFDALQLEDGAYNLRWGVDARGHAPARARISDAAGPVARAPAGSEVDAILAGLVGQTFGGYELVLATARPDNVFLCNETHYSAIEALRASARAGGRLRAVYFVHVPYARDGDHDALAAGVERLIIALVAGPATGA